MSKNKKRKIHIHIFSSSFNKIKKEKNILSRTTKNYNKIRRNLKAKAVFEKIEI